MRYKYQKLTKGIIGAFYNVYNRLGYGFLERVYENAMVIELQSIGLKVEQQMPIKVRYRGQVVGEYFADLVVEDKVIIELEAAPTFLPSHEAQLLNILKLHPTKLVFFLILVLRQPKNAGFTTTIKNQLYGRKNDSKNQQIISVHQRLSVSNNWRKR